MWKAVIGFIAFAAVAVFIIGRAGDKVDMGGEKQGIETVQTEPAKK
jgi:hypothetical protein